jgi:hypothetical protein
VIAITTHNETFPKKTPAGWFVQIFYLGAGLPPSLILGEQQAEQRYRRCK